MITDPLFWLVWVVLFSLAIYLIYRLVPKAEARRAGEAGGTRPCPGCTAQIGRDAKECPSCGRRPEPWTFHRGTWWRAGTVQECDGSLLWLDEKSNAWRRYRRSSTCPYCGDRMPVHERRCRDCGETSNPLEHPDPTRDLNLPGAGTG